MNIDMRMYVINNLKEDSKEDIQKSIEESIISQDEETLIGLGVLFELVWKKANNEEKEKMLDNIKKSMAIVETKA